MNVQSWGSLVVLTLNVLALLGVLWRVVAWKARKDTLDEVRDRQLAVLDKKMEAIDLKTDAHAQLMTRAGERLEAQARSLDRITGIIDGWYRQSPPSRA